MVFQFMQRISGRAVSARAGVWASSLVLVSFALVPVTSVSGGLVQAVQTEGSAVAPPASVADTVNAEEHARLVRLGQTFLLEKGQNPDDGSFSSQYGPGVTALCATALLDSGLPADHPAVAKAIGWLLKFAQPDGGFYAPESTLKNYETSIVVMCLTRANASGEHNDRIAAAVRFLKQLQWDEGEGHDPSSNHYGGQGYGSHKRPDASNTSFFIDALKDSGESMDSEAMQRAILFMSRTQNLSSAHNSAEWAARATPDDRGGFIYSPVGDGETKAEAVPGGGLRSYASMTYTGLKTFLYAGISREDLRVKAAQDWIARHYDLDSNPGIGQQGLYYYYHVFAKALNATGERTVRDADGKLHNWRSDLVAALAKRQQADGSWVNATDRWYEGDPNLVTAYSLMALRYCSPELDRDE